MESPDLEKERELWTNSSNYISHVYSAGVKATLLFIDNISFRLHSFAQILKSTHKNGRLIAIFFGSENRCQKNFSK